jgi:hypothetical protein
VGPLDDAGSTTPGLIGLRVADLALWLDARESGVPLALPGCHAAFLAEGTPREGLRLRVVDGPLHSTEGWQPLFRDGPSWQLWCDDAGRRVFAPSRHSPPPRQVAVDATFRRGELVGEFGVHPGPAAPTYPLQNIDMVLYANWLAETGDLILHAAGIDDQGAGLVFAGPSGIGKSTLTGELMPDPSVTVLGEDQVILRHHAGRSLVYGTPWHTDPARCSPGGVPLRKLFFLERGKGHSVEPCGPRAGIERLIQNALIPYYNRPGVERILDSLVDLAEHVQFYILRFQIGADSLKLIREA